MANRIIEVKDYSIVLDNVYYPYEYFSNSIKMIRLYNKSNTIFFYLDELNDRDIKKIRKKFSNLIKKRKYKVPEIKFKIFKKINK